VPNPFFDRLPAYDDRHADPDMRRMLDEQKLGFVATVCPDGTPNLSPKGTCVALDDGRLAFADIRSPRTIENLRLNPALSAKRHIVVMSVERAAPLISPAYDDGRAEAAVTAQWLEHWRKLWRRRRRRSTSG